MEKCKQYVWSSSAFHGHNCTRNAWKDGYCKQHHPDTVALRFKKSEERYEKQRKQSSIYKLGEAVAKIKKLEAKVEELSNLILQSAGILKVITQYGNVNKDEIDDWHNRAGDALVNKGDRV